MLGSYPQGYETINGYRPTADNFASPVTNPRTGEVTGYAIGPELEPMSDVALNRDLKSESAGPRNSAPYLLKLDTVERRRRAVGEAHTLTNILGGRYSGNVSNAVSAILRAIESGTEGQPLYGEKFADDARKAEQDLRRVTGNPNAIHNPFRN